jgi:hypothetical protein
MSLVTADLLALALKEPSKLPHELQRLGPVERRNLLDQAANGRHSVLLFDSLKKLEEGKKVTLALGKGVTIFYAKTSFPALGNFEMHFFQHGHDVWGRVVTTAPTFFGPGYFGVQEGNPLVVDFDRIPPADAVPANFPKVTTNASGLAAVAFGGIQLKFTGSGKGLLSGSVFRNGKNLGAYVNMVRAA